MFSIDVVSAIDDKYLPYISAVGLSVAETMKWPYRAVYHLIYDGPESDEMARLEAFRHPRLRYRFHRVDNPLTDLSPKGYLTSASYLRLIAPSLLLGLRRIIYLDADVVVHRSLHQLFQVPLNGNPIGGTTDLYLLAHRYLQQAGGVSMLVDHMDHVLKVDPTRYVNTGIMVLDLDALRRDNFTAKATAMARERHDDFVFYDQDIINVIYRDRIELIDARWNTIKLLSEQEAAFLPVEHQEDAERQRGDPFITHYAGSEKPWHGK